MVCSPNEEFLTTRFHANIDQVRTWRPDYASEIRQLEDGLGEAQKQRKNPAKINLRQFFGANVKFQKNLRRCVQVELARHVRFFFYFLVQFQGSLFRLHNLSRRQSAGHDGRIPTRRRSGRHLSGVRQQRFPLAHEGLSLFFS